MFNKYVLDACALSDKYPNLDVSISYKQEYKIKNDQASENEENIDEKSEIKENVIVDSERTKSS